MNTPSFALETMLPRVVKYLTEGLVLAVLLAAMAQFMANKKMDLKDIATMTLVVGTVLAVLDYFSPDVLGKYARIGAGLALGARLGGLVK